MGLSLPALKDLPSRCPERKYWLSLVGAVLFALAQITGRAQGRALPMRGAPAQAQPAAVVDWTLETVSPVQVVAPGQEGQVALVVRNTSAAPAAVTLHLGVESFDGEVTSDTVALTIPARSTVRQGLPRAAFASRGIKWVSGRIEQNGQSSPARRVSFAYMTPAGPTPGKAEGFLFGMAYGAGPDNKDEQAALAAAQCGVKVARGHVAWPSVQPREGEWRWEEADRILAAHEKVGIEVQLLLSGAPRWAVQPPAAVKPGEKIPWGSLPPRLDAWRAWVSALAQRYKGRVRFWEIWNEPDIGFFAGTTGQYLELLKAAHEEIKKVDPGMVVLSGGFASMTHRESKPGMLEMVLRDGQGWFDALAYHRHGPFGEFQQEIDHNLLPLRDRLLTAPKALYFIETAMDTRFGEQEQARTLVKKIVFIWSRGAMAHTWFNLHDMKCATSPRQPGFTYGLFTKENWPKAAYVAYNTLTRTLRGKRFVRQVQLAKDIWAMAFADQREQVIVSWNENPRAAAPHLLLSTDAASAMTVDLMGNKHPWTVHSGQTALAIGPEPAFLVLRGTKSEPQLEEELVQVHPAGMLLPGATVHVDGTIKNPT